MLKTVWYGFINVCMCVTLEVDTANSFIDNQSLLIDGWTGIIYKKIFLAFDFCRFCVVIRFFHPRHNG